jgi:hypothetical protein
MSSPQTLNVALIDFSYFLSHLLIIVSLCHLGWRYFFAIRIFFHSKRVLVRRWKLATTPKCFRYTQCNFSKSRSRKGFLVCSLRIQFLESKRSLRRQKCAGEMGVGRLALGCCRWVTSHHLGALQPLVGGELAGGGRTRGWPGGTLQGHFGEDITLAVRSRQLSRQQLCGH